MNNVLIAQLVAVAGFILGSLGLLLRWSELRRRTQPADRSPMKGDPNRGVTYALTIGMMPWAKESTRLHMIAYVRGIGFHAGIFTALAALAASPFWAKIPVSILQVIMFGLGLGALLGAAGGIMRLVENHLRKVSTPDDHFAVWLVTAFMASIALALWNINYLMPMYIVAALTLVYIPLGKIRHCMYFFFSRWFFGRLFGRRGVLPHPEPIKTGGLQ